MEKQSTNTKSREKMRSTEIFNLLDKFNIQEVESSLTYLYLEKLKKLDVKNRLLRDKIKDVNSKAIESIRSFIIDKKIDLTLKNIEKMFELLIEKKDRQINGAFYTPEFIVEYINDQVITSKNSSFKVCDCSCGSGAFLVLATEKIARENKRGIIETIEENIYGVDIMPESVNRTKIILSLLAIEKNEDKEDIIFNIKKGDSLDKNSFNWEKEFPEVFLSGGFDGVIGNPPYVRIQDFDNRLKDFLIKEYQTTNSGNFNLYFAFFELGLNLINEGGKLGYITPNNYFTSLSGKELRSFLQKNKNVSRIINFNHLRVFEDATTYTSITFLDKEKRDSFQFSTVENMNQLKNLGDLVYSNIFFSDLDPKKWRLMSQTDYNNIKKIEEKGTPLGKFASIKVGIATLKDNLYFIGGEKERGNYYVKEFAGKEFLIEKEITRKIIKIASVNSDEELIKDKRRIIFPYIKKDKNHYLIEEAEFKSKYPRCYEYLLAVKDELSTRDKGKSRIANWYAYGRGQGLNFYGKKLLTKTFSNRPNFMLDEDDYSLFCNGYAIFPKNDEDLKLLKRILNSRIMDYYARKTSVEIEGDYQCYQKNFIESFSIPNLTEEQKEYLLKEEDKKRLDTFLMKVYDLAPTNYLAL